MSELTSGSYLVQRILTLITLTVILPCIAIAQSSSRHATILGWEENTKHFMLDRAHNKGGTHFPRGLFREQLELMPPEYELDMMTYQHTAIDDYSWIRQDQGYRLFVGSLNAKFFGVKNYLKSLVEVNKSINLKIDGVHLENFRANRFFVSLDLEKKFSDRHRAGFYHTVTRDKGDLDAGIYYQYGNLEKGLVKLETVFLDYLSNVTEGLADGSQMVGRWYEKVHFYDKRPQLYSVKLASPKISHFRGELVAGIQTKMNKRVLYANSDEFRDREWAHYAGGLLEYFNRFLTVGLIYRRTFSKLKRTPLPGTAYEPEFGNWQYTNEFTLYATGDITNKIWFEQWTFYEFSTDRLQGDPVPEGLRTFDFKEERLKLKSRVFYDDRQRGLITGIEFHADYRYPQSEEELRNFRSLYHYQHVNKRLTYTIGYRVSQHFHFLGGISYDVDRDRVFNKEDYAWFDGGFGRLVVAW